MKQKATVHSWSEWLANLAISLENNEQVKVVRPTRHKIGHFGYVLPTNLSAEY